MRKVAVGLMVAAMVVLAGCLELPKLHVGAGFSGVLPQDENLDGTYQMDILARLDVAMVQVEMSVGWKTYEYQDSSLSEPLDLDVIPVAVVVKAAMGASAAKLLFGGGLVWNVNDVNEIAGEVSSVDSAIGYRIVAGALIGLPKGLDFVAELNYDLTEADLESALTLEPVDMSGLMVRAALSFHF